MLKEMENLISRVKSGREAGGHGKPAEFLLTIDPGLDKARRFSLALI